MSYSNTGSSVENRRDDSAIDQAALMIFQLINEFNDPKGYNLLRGYFKTDQDLRRLKAEILKVEAHVDCAKLQIQKSILQLKTLRKNVDYMISQL